MKNNINKNDFKKGLIMGLIESRGAFSLYLANKKTPAFRFTLELPLAQSDLLRRVKKYIEFGCIYADKSSATSKYYIGINKLLIKLIMHIRNNYPIKTQKYVLFKFWEKAFHLFANNKITFRNQRQFNCILRAYRLMERSNNRIFDFKESYHNRMNDGFIAGFVCGIINAKGYFDYKIYSEKKSGRKQIHLQPRFSFYLVLNRADYELANLIQNTLHCGKIYITKNTIQFTVASKDEIAMLTMFLDKYFILKPRIYEYKLWRSMFMNVQKYKLPSRRIKYNLYHKKLLKYLSNLFNSKRRLHMRKKEYDSMTRVINVLLINYERKVKSTMVRATELASREKLKP